MMTNANGSQQVTLATLMTQKKSYLGFVDSGSKVLITWSFFNIDSENVHYG
jgi:hypothetical protein